MIVPRERAARLAVPVELSKLLLVEGETPSHFFEAMARDLGIADEIEIRSYGGVAQLGPFLRTLATTAAFRTKVQSLGIVRDAETDPGAARQSLESAVAGADLPQRVSVRLAVVPDDRTPGMIETLCLRAVEAEPAYTCAVGFFDCLNARGIGQQRGVAHAKRVAQVYLAGWSEGESVQMFPGTAAYRGAWPFSHSTFASLREFLRAI